eukprot:jgi/Phyca11/547549/estExt2_Genewise1Plus.C_PHYCAscaffold_250206
MMEDWSLSTYYCTRIISAGEVDVEKAAGLLRIQHIQCIAHSILLIAAGTVMKPKVQSTTDELPPWAEDVEAESSEPILEHKEDEPLSSEDRAWIKNLRALAIDDVNEYLDKKVSPLKRLELDAMRGIIDKFRTLARYFIKSPKAQRQLEDIQVREYPVEPKDVVSLRLDCPTRSSTSLQLIQHFACLEPALASFFRHIKSVEGREEFQGIDTKLRKPQADEWLTLKCLSTLLSPFTEVHKILEERKYPTAQLILPVTSGIRKMLKQEDLFDSIAAKAGEKSYVGETVFTMNECRKTLLELLDDSFEGLEKSELVWASFLDPRIARTMPHLTELQPSYLDHDCNEEIRRYLANVKNSVGGQTDPFEWWRIHNRTYPNLSRLARKWMGVVATTVPSELAFSTSGTVATVKRSSLASSKVRDLVFVSENSSGYF